MSKKVSSNFNKVKKTNNQRSFQSTNNDRKIAVIILLVLFVFYTICSCLSIFTFVKSVSADSVYREYTFTGSNMTIWGKTLQFKGVEGYAIGEQPSIVSKNELSTINLNSFEPGFSYPYFTGENAVMNYKFEISDVLVNGEIHTDLVIFTSFAGYTSRVMSVKPTFPDFYHEHDSGYANGYILPNSSSTLINDFFVYDSELLPGNSRFNLSYSLIRVTRSSIKFISDIYRIDMGSKVLPNFTSWVISGDNAIQTLNNQLCNFIRYYDVNGEFIEFSIPVASSSLFKPHVELTPRTYYLLSNEDSENPAYKNGYADGSFNGYNDGYALGVKEGYAKGEKDGFAQGKIVGASSANDYTFLGLISSVIDAPIRALFGHIEDGQFINGLLSFEILGINLASFFSGLLTIGLILAVIRFIL